MRLAIFPLLCASLALIGTAVQAEFKQIKKEKQFRAAIVDKKLTDANGNWTIIKSDGSQSGQFNGNAYVGAWTWNGRYWCRNGKIGGNELGTNCQMVEIDGNQTRFTRDKGKGRSGGTFTIN